MPKLKVKAPTKWQGLKPNPDKYFGFLYLITELDTGMYYLGKKQYHALNPKRTRKNPACDMANWQPQHWKDSDWRTYTGSCVALNNAIAEKGIDNYTFDIIGQYSTKGDLVYAEVEALVKQDSLILRDDDGERLYYNGNISAIRFIPPNKEKETL